MGMVSGTVRAAGFAVVLAVGTLAGGGAFARGCEPAPVSQGKPKLPEAQRPLVRALLNYYDALNRKDFTALKALLDPSRTVDTAPGPSFGYRSLLGWRRFRIYATEVSRVDPDLNQVAVKEVLEAEGYNGAYFLYNSPAVYTFKLEGGSLLLSARGVESVDRTATKDPFELLYLYRDTLYRGDGAGASEYLERLLAQRPEDAYGVSMKAATLVQAGDHANALKLLDWVLALPEAKRDLCTVLGSAGFEAQVCDSAGVCHLALKDYEGARRALDRSRSLNPGYVPAILHTAELELALGRDSEARSWYAKAYAVLPDVPQAEVALFGNPAYGNNQAGMAYLKEERLDEAEAMFLQASRESPAYDKPYNNLGLVREKQGREAEAIALFRKALELNPRNTAVLINLANLYLSKGDRRSAESYIGKILDADPENLAALNLKDKAAGRAGA